MKKQALLIAALFVSLSMFSQKTYRAMGWKFSRDISQNELKVNLGTTIFGSFPEITYERIINSDLSVGAAVGVGLESDLYPVKVQFLPYVRWFFGGSSENLQKYGAGFFIEANAGLFSKLEDIYYYDDYGYGYGYAYEGAYTNSMYSSETENVFGAGLGVAVGWKYLSRNNWIGEAYFGVGRDFVNDGSYPRLGLTIGKRF